MVDVAIIGGGACGLILAAQLSLNSVRCAVIEKGDRVGKKLLSTGNGRCNLMNTDTDLSHFHGSLQGTLEKIMERVSPERIEDFWKDLGIDLVEGERGKLYPRSLQASSVLNALRRVLEKHQVQILTETLVTDIRPLTGREEGFLVVCGDSKVKARYTVLAAGGKASPAFGACGEGAKIASSLGLKVEALRPAICRLRADSPYMKRIAGVRGTVPASLFVDGKKVMERENEVLFTEDGLSGPAILDLSREAGEALRASKDVRIDLDLAAEYSSGELFAYLMERCERMPDWNTEELLEGWLPKKLILPVILEAGLDKNKKSIDLTRKEIASLRDVLKAFRFQIRSVDGFKEAQVTVGGVKGSELTEELEVIRYPGLFMGGEVVDVDGDCGGYNLMWAAASAIAIAETITLRKGLQ